MIGEQSVLVIARSIQWEALTTERCDLMNFSEKLAYRESCLNAVNLLHIANCILLLVLTTFAAAQSQQALTADLARYYFASPEALLKNGFDALPAALLKKFLDIDLFDSSLLTANRRGT